MPATDPRSAADWWLNRRRSGDSPPTAEQWVQYLAERFGLSDSEALGALMHALWLRRMSANAHI